MSVALCTYQGERHLEPQLASLLAQTHPPAEVLVSDDGSSDRTLELLERFRQAAPFPVDVRRTEHRLGSTANFAQLMARCTGPIIALCDQDDIWYDGKLQRLVHHFDVQPRPALVFSDADLIGEDGRLLGPGLWEGLGFAPSLQRRFAAGSTIEVLCIGNVVTGATCAVDVAFRDLVLPIPAGWVHDAWLALVLACVAPVRMVSEPLVRYRLHNAQQIGVPAAATRLDHLRRRSQLVRRMKKKERHLLADQARLHAQVLDRVLANAGSYPPRPEALSYLQGKIDHLGMRATVQHHATTRRVAAVAREAATGRYRRFSNGWSSFAKDLLLLDEHLDRRAG